MIQAHFRLADQLISGALRRRAGWPPHFAGIDIVRGKLRLAERVNLEDDPDTGVAPSIIDRTVDASGPS
jgi:hypothetical protein